MLATEPEPQMSDPNHWHSLEHHHPDQDRAIGNQSNHRNPTLPHHSPHRSAPRHRSHSRTSLHRPRRCYKRMPDSSGNDSEPGTDSYCEVVLSSGNVYVLRTAFSGLLAT